ncbi:NAD-dependent epimerase/dehydratase family protein [Zhongshania sp.]|uniref:NAD-dependent epimerase/dehydratase family protein n=1 Tax=Zhongshania sp. TaxID=1971902 RepID=UPI003568E8FC
MLVDGGSGQKKLLIVGCGDIGSGLAENYLPKGWQVQGLRRNAAKLAPGITALEANVCDPSSVAALGPLQTDYVVVTLTPGGNKAEAYQAVFEQGLATVLAAIAVPPKHIFFVSSTGVYAQSKHELIDEESETVPDRFSGQSLLKAERAIAATGWPYSNIRFGGIYGTGRFFMLNKVLDGDCAPAEPLHYTNRIHRDDCVGFIAHLIDQAEAGEKLENCYLGVDDEAASIQDVQAWLAAQLGVTYASKGEPIARTGSKRCINRRLRESGYTMKYPTFRDGFAPVLRAWRASTGKA